MTASPAPRPADLPREFGCYSMSLTSGRVCTLAFNHDDTHVAHGPDGIVETWERAANDRTASEHEAAGLAPIVPAAPTYVVVSLDDARPGDEVFQGGEWTPVAAFHVFGSRRDLVKIVFPGGGSLAIPVSHCPTIRRAVEAAPAAGTRVRSPQGWWTSGRSLPAVEVAR